MIHCKNCCWHGSQLALIMVAGQGGDKCPHCRKGEFQKTKAIDCPGIPAPLAPECRGCDWPGQPGKDTE